MFSSLLMVTNVNDDTSVNVVDVFVIKINDGCISTAMLLENAELQFANENYSMKLDLGSAKEKTLRELAYKVDDLSHLSQTGRTLLVGVATKIDLLEKDDTDFVSTNLPRQLSRLQEELRVFVKGIDY